MSLYTGEGRPTGFLRKSDRRYLKDPEGYVEEHTRQTGNNRRRAIKQRLAQTFVDLTLLSHVDDEVRDDLLEGAAEELDAFEEKRRDRLGELREDGDVSDISRFEEYQQTTQQTDLTAMSLLYEFFEDHVGVGFDDFLGAAITVAVRRNTDREREFTLSAANVDIDEPEKVDTERVREKVEKGRYFDLDRSELLYTVYTAALDADAYNDTLPDHIVADVEGVRRELTKSPDYYSKGTGVDYAIVSGDEEDVVEHGEFIRPIFETDREEGKDEEK